MTLASGGYNRGGGLNDGGWGIQPSCCQSRREVGSQEEEERSVSRCRQPIGILDGASCWLSCRDEDLQAVFIGAAGQQARRLQQYIHPHMEAPVLVHTAKIGRGTTSCTYQANITWIGITTGHRYAHALATTIIPD